MAKKVKLMKCTLAVNHVVFAPLCFSCDKPATHVSAGINPSGQHDYQCAEHAVDDPGATWGSDPGWNTPYLTLASEEGKAVWSKDMGRRRSQLRAKGLTDQQIDAAVAKIVAARAATVKK